MRKKDFYESMQALERRKREGKPLFIEIIKLGFQFVQHS